MTVHFRTPTRFLVWVGMPLLFAGLLGCDQPGSAAKSNSASTSDAPPPKDPPAAKADEGEKQACREAVQTLMEYAQKGKNAEAAPMLVYRGEDKSREWKSTCDYAQPEDQLQVDKTMAKLQVITSGMESHSFQDFVVEQENEGTWYVWVVELKYEDDTRDQKAFAFLKIGKKFALGDID